MTETVVSPDERAFRAHVDGARFQHGVDSGRWRLVSVDWPTAMIAVTAAPRAGAPDEYVLRFDLANYPQSAPTAGAWNLEADALLREADRPKGGQAAMVFRADWENGRALYAPYDRVAIETHGPEWASKYPKSEWTPRRDLAFYLSNVSEVLHDDDYQGT